jgi:hypothetical protein
LIISLAGAGYLPLCDLSQFSSPPQSIKNGSRCCTLNPNRFAVPPDGVLQLPSRLSDSILKNLSDSTAKENLQDCLGLYFMEQ